jgi:hypothetical protein
VAGLDPGGDGLAGEREPGGGAVLDQPPPAGADEFLARSVDGGRRLLQPVVSLANGPLVPRHGGHDGHDDGPREAPPGPAQRRADSEPDALAPLLDLEGDVHRRVDEAGAGSSHPRAYLCRDPDGTGTAHVGSSNLSATAIRRWKYSPLRKPSRPPTHQYPLGKRGV